MSGTYSFLIDGLAQGSAPPTNVRLPFDTIVLSAKEYQPRMPGYDVLYVPLDDSEPTDAERAWIRRVASEVAHRVRSGERVLVTCWQGRNRSGVIAGLALVELGMPRSQAIRRIRALRNGLTNPYFYAMVDGSI
jgi:protein-tyrosine phosphatase